MTRAPAGRHVGRTMAMAIVLVVGVSATAVAHVEVEGAPTSQAAARGEVVITVPNESADADTTSVAVKLPDNVLQAEFPDVAGWRATGQTAPLGSPLQIGGQVVTTRVATVTWTGGRIRPGRSAQFRLRVRVREGSTRRGLAFPTVQRYSDGTVVRWIGAPDSENPAGVLRSAVPVVSASAAPTPSTPTGATTSGSTTSATVTAAAPGGGTSGLAIGLIIAAVVVALGSGAYVATKRRKQRP